jgi:hypothetical protein
MSTADDTDNDLIAGLVRDAMTNVLDHVEGGDGFTFTVLLHPKAGPVVAVNLITRRGAGLQPSRDACAVCIEQIDHTV